MHVLFDSLIESHMCLPQLLCSLVSVGLLTKYKNWNNLFILACDDDLQFITSTTCHAKQDQYDSQWKQVSNISNIEEEEKNKEIQRP